MKRVFSCGVFLALLIISSLVMASSHDAASILAEQLRLDSRIHSKSLNVVLKKGSVVVSGVLESLGESDLVEEIAKRTLGDTGVDVQIRVVPQIIADTEIQRIIAAIVPTHCMLEIKNFSADVHQGGVTLSGSTSALYHRVMVEYLIRNIKGIKSVTNRINVMTPRLSDISIRNNIIAMITPYLERVNIGNIEVTTSDGHVVLNGKVDGYEQKRQIEEISQNVSGVVSIKNKIVLQLPGRGKWR